MRQRQGDFANGSREFGGGGVEEMVDSQKTATAAANTTTRGGNGGGGSGSTLGVPEPADEEAKTLSEPLNGDLIGVDTDGVRRARFCTFFARLQADQANIF